MNIVVLDGHGNQAVACVRSYARAGHRVILGCDRPSWTAGWSRYCQEKFIYPRPQDDGDAFIECIARKVAAVGGALVVAMTERTTLKLSACRDKIGVAGGSVVLPSHETVLRAFDKLQTLELARSLGIDTPYTMVVEERTDLASLIPTLSYPVVLKARASEELRHDGTTVSAGVQCYAQNQKQFLTALETLRRQSTSILVQEFIEGRGIGYFALLKNGEVRAEFAHQRIRDVRPCGSGSSFRKSVILEAQVRTAGLAMLRALEWHGAAMVEFRMRRDGTPVFMEVNGRFWNSLALAIHAGVDFPVLVAELAQRGDVRPQLDYKSDVRCRWLLGDFRHLVEVWRGKPDGFPEPYPPKLRTLLAVILPAFGTHHDNFEWDDPLPEIGDWLHFFMRKAPETFRRLRTPRERTHAQRRSAHS